MIKNELAKVMKFAGNIKKLYIIIRDKKYWQPQIMTMENTLEPITGVQFAITGNFNAETLTSIWENGYIVIILWNKQINKGYQLIGLPVKIDILSIDPLPQGLPVSTPGTRAGKTSPRLSVQVERKMYFNAEQIIEFDNNAEPIPETDLDELREEIEHESLINY